MLPPALTATPPKTVHLRQYLHRLKGAVEDGAATAASVTALARQNRRRRRPARPPERAPDLGKYTQLSTFLKFFCLLWLCLSAACLTATIWKESLDWQVWVIYNVYQMLCIGIKVFFLASHVAFFILSQYYQGFKFLWNYEKWINSC